MSELLQIINDAKTGVDFGVINLTLKIHEGELSTVDTTKVSSYKTPKGNVEAMSIVTALFKGVIAAEESANLTMTITFDHGKARRVQVQDIKKNIVK